MGAGTRQCLEWPSTRGRLAGGTVKQPVRQVFRTAGILVFCTVRATGIAWHETKSCDVKVFKHGALVLCRTEQCSTELERTVHHWAAASGCGRDGCAVVGARVSCSLLIVPCAGVQAHACARRPRLPMMARTIHGALA